MPQANVNGVSIEYDTFGDKNNPAIVLIMGLGVQMIGWDSEFTKMLSDNGYYVIRFDNRDVGLSQWFDDDGMPDVMQGFTDFLEGKPVKASYSLDDMADDTVGLLDHLGIEKAHICGVSMGGAITQVIGYKHPSRAISLITIMTATSPAIFTKSKPEAMQALLVPSPPKREAYVDNSVNLYKMISGSKFPLGEERSRLLAGKYFDRSYHPEGTARQMMAILSNGDVTPQLKSVATPTLVIHGSDDPLIPVEGGKDIAEVIPNAKLKIIDGWGHSLPVEVWPILIEAITGHIKSI
mgnify:FL=1